MTAASGIDPELLSLPCGGGAVSSIGPTFDVDLNTGTASSSIPLELPPGPNGLKPELAIRYHSGAGDGILGMGWTLSVPTITREPRTNPQSTVYVLASVGNLRRTAADLWRPEVDNLGNVIRHGSDTEAWQLVDTSDTVHWLGSTPQSRITGADEVPVMWVLDRIADAFGNTVDYSWRRDAGQLYLDQVHWGTWELNFVYEPRPDRLLDGHLGVLIETLLRCVRIELRVPSLSAPLVRTWELAYDDQAGTGRSSLASVTVVGHAPDGTRTVSAPTKFGYTRTGAPRLTTLSGWNPGSLRSNTVDFVDLSGDGLPDAIDLGSGDAAVWRNLGRERWSGPHRLNRMPNPVRLGRSSVSFADMNGDGAADLLMLEQPMPGFYPFNTRPWTRPDVDATLEGLFDRPVLWRQAPSYSLASPDVRVLDLNGDLLTDLLVDTGRAWMSWTQDSANGWASRPVVLAPSDTPPARLSDPRVFVADLTGDGRPDILHVQGNALLYWPSLGFGRWGTTRRMSIAGLPNRLDPRRVLFADVDGDGCADTIYVDSGRVLIWWNTGSDRMSGPTEIRGTPISSPGGFRTIDLNGSDTIGVLFDVVSPGARHSQCYLQPTGGQKPYLLTSIDHGTGATTEISYRPSTEFALDDRDAGQPWRTFHPFPIHCVAKVTRTDSISGIAQHSLYRYHDGRFDPATRTFVGFGRVTADALGDESAPTLRTVSEFHVGLDPADPFRALSPDERLALGGLRRRPLTVTVRGVNADGSEQQPVTITRYEYATFSTPTLDGGTIVMPYTTSTVEERWEGQAERISTHRIEFLDVDEHGTVRRQRSTVTAADGTVARDLYIDATMATGGVNLRLPARASQRDADGNIVALTVNYYDGPEHVGLPEGQATLGALRRTEDLILTDTLVSTVWGDTPPDLESLGYHRLPGEEGWWITRSSRAELNENGVRVLVTRGPRGAETTVRLDATGQYVASIVDARGNTCSAAYDVRSGQVSQITDENGVSRQDVFDSLGRVVGTLFPGDPVEAPSQSWSYRTDTLPLRIDAQQRAEVNGAALTASITYLDGLGKIIARLTPAGRVEGQPALTWVVSQAHRFNSRGLVQASWLPYLTASEAFAPPPDTERHVLLTYNASGQVVREVRPDGQTVTYERTGDGLLVSSGPQEGPLRPRERHDLDACGQMTRVSRWDGTRWVSQSYAWDARGRLVSTTTPDGAEVVIVYDLRGRAILSTSPETGRTQRLYDANGSEVLRRNAAGQEVRREYDSLRRVLNVHYSGGVAPDVSYEYLDASSPVPPDGVRFRIGRLWKVHDAIGELSAAYDELGRTVSSTRTDTPLAGVFTTDVTYDRLSRIVSIVLPALPGEATRERVDYTYDDAGRALSASGVVSDVGYDLWGRIVRLQYANGTMTENKFDPTSGRLVRQTITALDGTTLGDETATYDDNGQLISLAGLQGLTTFDYDGLQRLIGMHHPTAPTETFGYSDGGNMTLGTAGAMSYQPSSGLLLSAGGESYVHDAAGRLAMAPYGTLRFDGADHLVDVQLATGVSLEHRYDHADRHVSTIRAGKLQFLAISEHLELRDGRATLWLSFGGRRLLALSGGERRWLHPDLRGNVSLITDSSGRIAFKGAVGAYGMPLGSAGTALPGAGFLGATTDDSGLMCLGLRWYDPRLGRFISPDPMVAGIYVIDAWNPYVYAHNNPVLFVDSSGAWSFWGVLAVAVLVAVIVVAAVFTGGAALAGLGILSTALETSTLVAVGIGAFGGALAGGLSAMKAGGSVWGGALLGGIIGGACALAGGAIGSSIIGSLGRTYGGFILSGTVQGAVGGFGTGFVVGIAGGKGTLGAALLAAARGAIWGAFLGGVLGGGSRLLFVGNEGEHNYFEFGTANRYLPEKPGEFKSALDVGDNTAGSVEDAAFTGSHIAHKSLALGDVGDIIDITAIRDIGQKNYDAIKGAFFEWGADGSLFIVNLSKIADALSNGGIALTASGSVLFDANGFSYANQFALLLKNIPLLGNFLALSDERKLGWYEDATKGFDVFFGSHAGNG